ncbi:hypothetical protein DFH06DRAFT_1480531 [Mycena polygramma]|nr:hypothetical protein DFH06DRAFT_1480531 [Mycena polygramma]
MQSTIILPPNLVTLVLESFLYGTLLLLFISTVYFLAARRTLAGTKYTVKHHLTSTVFLGIAVLFIVVTIHWGLVIYQAFFAFIHLGSAVEEVGFYADLAQQSEIAKLAALMVAVLLGDALVTYRLWIIWGENWHVAAFPILCQLGLAGASVGMILEIMHRFLGEPGEMLIKEERPFTASCFVLSLLANIYSTGFISYRIWRATRMISTSQSRLRWFLSILVESAALQTIWLIFCSVALLFASHLAFVGADNFPVILGISNSLIHARVGLGWSQDRSGQKAQSSPQDGGDVV